MLKTFGSRRSVALIVAALVLLASLAGIARSVHIVSRSSEAVESSYQQIVAAEKLLSLAQDIETGQRGYLITGNPEFLRPYAEASASIGTQLTRLSAIVEQDAQGARLARIRAAIVAKLSITDRTIELARRGDVAAARVIVEAGEGKARMDDIRREIGGFLDEQHALLAERRRQADGIGNEALIQALLAATLTLAAGGLMAVTARRTRVELTRRTGEVETARRRLKATFDHAAVGIAHLAPDGSMLRVNQQLCDIAGRDADELIGRWFETLTHPEDVPRDLASRRDLLVGKTDSYTLEQRLLRPDGRPVWASLNVTLVRDEGGAPDFFVSVVKDISDTKRFEARLLSGEAQYRAIHDTAVEAIAVIDARGVIQSANPAAERVFGYMSEELIGQNIAMLMPQTVGEHHDNYLERYRETGRRAIIGIGREVQGRRKDGSLFPADLSVAEWRSDGETFFTGILRDISVRKAQEAALAEAEARFRLAQESVQAGIWETDLTSHRSTLSRESMRLFGFDGSAEGQFAPGEWGDLFEPSDRTRANARYERAIANGERFDALLRVPLKKGGLRWIQILGQAEYDAAGKPLRMMGLTIDVTSRRRAEEALRDSEERLRVLQNDFAHLARVNELGELAAAIAHEINQPLTAISNYLNVGRFALDHLNGGADDTEALEEASEVMGLASDQAVRAGDIVRRLREFVGKGTGARQREDADDLVDSAMALSLVDADLSGIDVARERGAANAIVEVDGLQIQQVLVNLLRNAIDALVQMPTLSQRSLRVATRLVDEGESVEIEVRDNGPGIAPDIRERLFEPFVTSKAHGMGMGLSLSRRLIEAHGGSIEVQSAPGEGAAFRFRLPAQRQSEPASA
ncbi:PAS domain S-box protein [Sphingoaurantiacus capsulatus]|uniref:histidine kinase n=1 Tax=Sphingoaurantiacus capsulatus TaxID=1771310 RepID=A0ABV7X5K6_9SPHN